MESVLFDQLLTREEQRFVNFGDTWSFSLKDILVARKHAKNDDAVLDIVG